MYTITGVTGHVGAAAATALLDRGAEVRVVTRDSARQVPWRRRGADAALADFDDPVALARALRGSDGAFVLLPTDVGAGDEEHRRRADHIAAAVTASDVPHVVMLSSIGADLAEGTGPIRWLHHLEGGLTETGTVLTALRPTHFQEKVETILDAVAGAPTPSSGPPTSRSRWSPPATSGRWSPRRCWHRHRPAGSSTSSVRNALSARSPMSWRPS